MSTARFSSKYTPVFNEFLFKAGISVLVSTYQAGRLILLRPGPTLNTHFVAIEKPMGMALYGSRLSVGSGSQIWDYFNMPAVADKVGSNSNHDACFIPRRLHITGDIDIHEMAFDRHGELWFVNTRMSCLCTLELKYSVVPKWRPPFISAYDLSDRCHLNGIAMRNGKPAYATALGETDTPGGWRERKANGGILMEIDTGRIICRGLSMPHSPRWHNDKLYVLESGAGRIITVNPEDGSTEVVAEVPGFCRGISFVGPYALVGLSQVRETAVFAGLPLTRRFAERFCGIWLIDLRNGAILGWLQFNAAVQEIFAVEVLPYRNPAILDHSDPLVRSSYSLPDEALKDIEEQDPIEYRISAAAVLRREGKLEEAAQQLKMLLEQAPGNSTAAYLLGDTLVGLGRWKEAVKPLELVVDQDKENANACLLLGNSFLEMGRYEKALKLYEKALSIDKGYADAHCAKGMLLLRLGRFKEGWEEYKWRRKKVDFLPFHSLKPEWNGGQIGDKKLLLHLESSIRDALALARFFPAIAQYCKHLIIAAPEPLRLLMEEIPGVSWAQLPSNIQEHEFDLYLPLLKLPLLDNLRKAISSIGENRENIPYLKVPQGVAVSTIESQKALKVGVFWSNEAIQSISLKLKHFKSIADVDGIKLFGLQAPAGPDDEKIAEECGLERLDHQIATFAHMAALINQLDLLITVDSPAAHIAGGLGVPVWVLLRGNAHWCWPIQGSKSPWYPTARIFQMVNADSPKAIMNDVKKELMTLLSKKKSSMANPK